MTPHPRLLGFNTFRLFRKAFGAYYLQIILIVVLAFVSSVVEGLGISAVVPVFSFFSGGGGQASDLVTKFIQGFFSFFHITYTFRFLLAFIGILFVVRTVLLFFVQLITSRIVFGYERDMRRRLFAATIEAGWPYLAKQKLGNLSQLLMQNASQASQFFTYFSLVVIIVTKTIAYMFVAVNVSPLIAVFALVAGAAAFFLFQPLFKQSRSFAFENEKLGREVSHFVNQHILGMKTVKTMAIEEPVDEVANAYFDKMRVLSVSLFTMRGLIQMLVGLGGLLFIGIAFAIMYRLPGFQIATFGVVVFAINQIFSQVQLVQAQAYNMGNVLPYLKALMGYEDETRANSEEPNDASRAVVAFSQGIEFEQVSFSYPERGAVLSDANFRIKHGEMLGVIGPSGAGKTTIADLLLRLYEPSAGSILVDGKPLSTLPLKPWRASIGYVTQDLFLLNDTLANNISFYEPIAHEEIVAAAKLAHIHEFIESLPHGYDTKVGDRGVLLSGGQRQRIVLARILARKPALLILDEATSSLDTESERAIQSTIEELRGHMTTVVIAHRLSTVANADAIVVLESSRIIETGSPAELLKNPDSYFSKMVAAGGGSA